LQKLLRFAQIFAQYKMARIFTFFQLNLKAKEKEHAYLPVDRVGADIEQSRKRFDRKHPPNRSHLPLPSPRVVELFVVQAPQHRRAVAAFYKAFS
jgi:hypothetical protein